MSLSFFGTIIAASAMAIPTLGVAARIRGRLQLGPAFTFAIVVLVLGLAAEAAFFLTLILDPRVVRVAVWLGVIGGLLLMFFAAACVASEWLALYVPLLCAQIAYVCAGWLPTFAFADRVTPLWWNDVAVLAVIAVVSAALLRPRIGAMRGRLPHPAKL